MIDFSYSIFKLGRIEKKLDKRSSKAQWIWRVNSREAKTVLEVLLPYLKVKKRQAELTIKFQSSKKYKGEQRLTEKEFAERVREEMMALNGVFR